VVIIISLLPIPARITAARQELTDLHAYTAERLAAIVKEVGFRCNFCAKCCTRAFNGHIFLLDRDTAAVKEIDSRALEPAPYPEFCDQNGTFYVSGYALRVQDDEQGSCYFLKNGKCRIYDHRFSICRIYPYMLHREPDEKGKVDWRQVSGLDEHGEYNTAIPEEECLAVARETKEYEEAYLMQEIGFLIFIQDYFARHHLRHVQKVYDDQLKRFNKGEEITVMVYYDGLLEQHRIRNR
jgi:Fe-S-cluster containining protein